MSHKRHGEHQEPKAGVSSSVTAENDPPLRSEPEGDGQLRQDIEFRAYCRYCERGCAPGGDVEDWLAAEQDVLTAQRSESPETR